ncbi:MAG: MBL fold metallo-hydrolase [Mycobacteriales bacterium]
MTPATLPRWARLVRCDNPSPMTLEGTNTWLIDGGALDLPGTMVVVDPGPLDERHLQAVAAAGPVALVLLTHRHPDHAEGAQRFAEITGAAVLDRADFSTEGGDVPGVRVLYTPGHTSDSVSFVVTGPEGGDPAVLTGDTILGRGSTVVAHPDGDLRSYLSSLERLRNLGDIPVLPGHGPVLPSAAQAATGYLAHRAQRLDQVRAARAAGDQTAGEIVQRVYADVDPSLWPAAEMSVQAQLAYLDS